MANLIKKSHREKGTLDAVVANKLGHLTVPANMPLFQHINAIRDELAKRMFCSDSRIDKPCFFRFHDVPVGLTRRSVGV